MPDVSTQDDLGPESRDTGPRLAPLNAQQLEALRVARLDGRRVARASTVATFSGWTIVTFAVLTILSGIFSLPALFLGLGMSIVGVVELRGARALRRLELPAARRLALNQLALGLMFCVYGIHGLVRALTGPGPYDEHLAAGGDVAQMLEPIAALHVLIAVLVSAAVMVGGVVATGCTSLYYLTRRRHLEAYVQRTPDWVIDAIRALEPGGERTPESNDAMNGRRAAA